jgi:hypothetical protein
MGLALTKVNARVALDFLRVGQADLPLFERSRSPPVPIRPVAFQHHILALLSAEPGRYFFEPWHGAVEAPYLPVRLALDGAPHPTLHHKTATHIDSRAPLSDSRNPCLLLLGEEGMGSDSSSLLYRPNISPFRVQFRDSEPGSVPTEVIPRHGHFFFALLLNPFSSFARCARRRSC